MQDKQIPVGTQVRIGEPRDRGKRHLSGQIGTVIQEIDVFHCKVLIGGQDGARVILSCAEIREMESRA